MIPALHVIDFEGHPRYGVVEYGIVTWSAEGIVATETRLCAPTGEIPPADTRVHGIDRSMAEGREAFAVEYQRWVALRRTGLFCAHNAVFEHHLLKSTWNCPPFVPDWRKAGREVADWGPWLDTVKLARALQPGAESCALGALSYDGPLGERVAAQAAALCPPDRCRPHCALFDAVATVVWLEERVGFARAIDWFRQTESPAPGQAELF